MWIDIDPNILLQGLDATALFKCENYLKFNLGSNSDKEKERIDCNNQTKTEGNDNAGRPNQVLVFFGPKGKKKN